ncbi:MAG: helix-turn-helix domain-containing protein [Firmicutes bacterium]|nr:helix-turn-helix domain-containing protein [Bacillota bacterium]
MSYLLPQRLKELRIEKGLSQRNLSKATGLSQPAIVHWENNKRVPNAEVVMVIANFFGVTAGYLLGLED